MSTPSCRVGGVFSSAIPLQPSSRFQFLWNFSERWTARAAAILMISVSTALLSAADSPPKPDGDAKTEGRPARPPSKFKDFAEVTKDTERFDGLFTLFRTNQTLFAEIKPHQLQQPLLAPIVIARGLAAAGTPLNFGDEWVVLFRRVGDAIQLVRRNIHYEAPKDSPLRKAMEQNYTDSILLALPIVSINPNGGGLLIDFSDIFLRDFAQLGIGSMDRSRSSWHKIKAFENNVELQVEATFDPGPRGGAMGLYVDGVVDPRGLTLILHYSLAKLPNDGYKPRLADQRVGHFINATKDFSSKDPDSQFVRRINRWRIEKADPKAPLSPPKKQLVWWVEDNVPHEYRPYVEEGILEWNKAFEKIGIRNALGVRWQNERDEFDPEDINYCTFRWITTPFAFAMSGLRANPITGEMIDGDVIFDANLVRMWEEEYALMLGSPAPGAIGQDPRPLDVAEIISPIMAAKHGYGLPIPMRGEQWKAPLRFQEGAVDMPQLAPSTWSPLHLTLSRRLSQGRHHVCQCNSSMRREFSLAAMAFAVRDASNTDLKPPPEFLGQAIKYVVMHEVGHSLGLRHNFKASSMLSQDQLNDTEVTRKKGLVGSVMDYAPINIARKGQKQGDYATTTIGPYDYWAIEYAYKPIEGDEAAELKKIAARSPEADLAFATDEDVFLSEDPMVNAWDLGSDALRYGKERITLAAELLKEIDNKIVRDGESWARVRLAFSILLGEYGNGAYLAASYIGGQSFSRDFKGGESNRDPITPVAGGKQREALQFLAGEILSDKAFDFKPALLRRLTVEHWYHWGSDSFSSAGGIDYPVFERVLSIQKIALSRFFDPGVLRRIQNQQLLAEKKSDALKIDEVFRTSTDAIWSELSADASEFSIIRRNLQREHLRQLCSIVLGPQRNPYEAMYPYAFLYGASRKHPEDARNLARAHLGNLHDNIGKRLNSERALDEATSAHLAECRARISRVLEAQYSANEP